MTSTEPESLNTMYTFDRPYHSTHCSLPMWESLHEVEDVFSKEAFDALPQTCQWDHAIELNTDNPRLQHSKVYPMSLNEQAELDTFLDEAPKTGRICPSKSLIKVPVFFIKKKDGSL